MNDNLQGIRVTLVTNLQEADEFLTWLGQRRPILAIDTETTGLKWWTPGFCRLVQFGDGERAYALGVREWWQIIADAMDRIVRAGVPVAMHNAKFDMHSLESADFAVPAWHNIYDTKIMDHLCYPIRSHALKMMGKRRFGGWATVGDAMLKDHFSTAGVWWDTVDINEERYWAYGCMDTVLTARFAIELGREMKMRNLLPAFERESAVQAIAYRVEKRGLLINTEYTERLLEQWAEEIVGLRMQLDAWGVDNPGSKMQVVNALKAKENWDPEAFTDTGEPQLTKSILASMDSRIAPLVLRYKRLVKWSGTYLEHFLNEQVNGVVHPNINTMAARTGRMSITGPPMQTLPAKKAGAPIRHCIMPPEGHWLWPVDYDGQELRVMASKANDPGLIQLFEDGLDPHSYVASVVYGLDYNELESGLHVVQRGTAKNCVTPDTLVLTSKLRWMKAGELRVGDRLVAFDADLGDSPTSRGKARRWREARVNTTGFADRPTVRVRFSDGSELVGTEDHPIITRHTGWRNLGDLKPGNVVVKALNVRTVDPTRRAGWLAGMFDGEGWVTQATGEIGVSQNEGSTADLLRDRLGASWSESVAEGHARFRFRGTQGCRTEWLTSVGVGEAKAADYVRAMEGSVVQGHDVTVVSVESAGVQRIVTLGTDQLTYVSEGFLSHNTQYSRIYGAGDDKIAETAGVPVSQISEFKRIYDVRFPGVQRYMNHVESTAKQRLLHEGEPYTFTSYGRWLNVEPDKLYALVNYDIQGECADVLKDKTVLLDRMGFGDNIMLWVHDEVLFSFPEGDRESIREAAAAMEEYDRYRVPLTVEAKGPYSTWGQAYS